MSLKLQDHLLWPVAVLPSGSESSSWATGLSKVQAVFHIHHLRQKQEANTTDIEMAPYGAEEIISDCAVNTHRENARWYWIEQASARCKWWQLGTLSMMRQQHKQIWAPGDQGKRAQTEHFHYSHLTGCEGAPSFTAERIDLRPTRRIKPMKKSWSVFWESGNVCLTLLFWDEAEKLSHSPPLFQSVLALEPSGDTPWKNSLRWQKS